MKQITINGGIGDILHSKPLLDQLDYEYSLHLSERAVAHYRDERHIEFSRWLAWRVFERPVLSPPDGVFQGWTPQDIVRELGVTPVCPDFRRYGKQGHAVCVLTKIRGWRRERYNAIRAQFMGLISDVAKRWPLHLVGERRVTMFREYQIHTDNLVYSIYDDIIEAAGAGNYIDSTQETMPPCPDPALYHRDLAIIESCMHVIVLGTGGNASMGMAYGNCCPIMAHETEMGGFFFGMPPSERVPICKTTDEWFDVTRSSILR